jgi:uncharacterized protein YbaR (Trm112 family)
MEVKLIVPDSLAEVTLGQYQDYLEATKDMDEEKDAHEMNKRLIEAFCGIEYELVDSIPIMDIEKLLEALKMAFERDYDLTTRFDLLDVDMGFIPKLDDMSLGEYIDCENYIGKWQDMHKAMAVLYRPVNFKSKDKYTIAPYKPSEEIQELMKEMPLSVVMGSMVFFYRLGMELSKAMLNYIQNQLEKNPDTTSQVKMALERSGVGINQFIHSLKEMSEGLTKLRSLHSITV